MKKYIFFLLLLICKYLSAETVNIFINEKFNWADIETNISIENKFRLINQLPDNLVELIESPVNSSLEDNINDFHFIDINYDGNIDVIYNGYAGGEIKNVIVYLYSNDKYIKVLDKYGIIINVFQENLYSYFSIKILDYGFHHNSVNSIQLFTPFINDSLISYNLTSKLNYIKGTKFPDSINSNIVKIRTIDVINPLQKIPFIKEQQDSNSDNEIVAVYPIGSLGLSISEINDNYGIEWCFVIMYNNKKTIKSIFNEGNNKGNFFSVGWIKKEKLVFLNS